MASIALHGHHQSAYAKGDDDDDGDGGDDGGDKGAKGDSSDEGEDDPEDTKGQPPVTAGGLFTIDTYPARETERPLTMTQGVTQLRASLGTDISAKGAFATGGLSLDVQHGLTDNFTLLGGFQNAYNMKQFSIYGGFEGALAYDMLDVRLAANIHRNAIPEFQNFCTPVATGDPTNPSDATTCKAGAAASIVNLPDGNYSAGDLKFSIDLGFPFRYAFNPQIAVVALQTLISIDFNSAARDHTTQVSDMITDSMGMPAMITRNVPAPNGAKPDLNPSIGFLTNPIPQLSIVVMAQLRVPDFDTSAGAFQVPVTASVEFVPAPHFDVGLSFTLLNVKPPDPQSPIDNRFISAYVQARL